MDVETLAAIITKEWYDRYSDDGRVWKKAKLELTAALALATDETKAAAYDLARAGEL